MQILNSIAKKFQAKGSLSHAVQLLEYLQNSKTHIFGKILSSEQNTVFLYLL